MGRAIDSREASEVSAAAGYRNQTPWNLMSGAVLSPAPLGGSATAPGFSAISGFRSSTSNSRS